MSCQPIKLMPGPLTPNAKAPWAFSYVLLVALFLGETFEILSQAFSTDANAQSFLTIFSEYKHKCPDFENTAMSYDTSQMSRFENTAMSYDTSSPTKTSMCIL